MKFEVGCAYTHKNMMDVCMLVICVERKEYFMDVKAGLKLYVRWFLKSGRQLTEGLDCIFIQDGKEEDWDLCTTS